MYFDGYVDGRQLLSSAHFVMPYRRVGFVQFFFGAPILIC